MSQLELLLAHADDRQPVLARGLDDAAVPHEPAADAQTLGAGYMRSDAANQNDLNEQRWGVIVPEGAVGQRLVALIAPLIAARTAAQEGRAVQIYTVPAKMDMAQAAQWHKQHFDTGKDTTEDLPRYQLILGDLDQVPLAVQQVQSADNYVGRLAFADEDGYLAYVEKILRWEKTPHPAAQARSLLFTVHDQTAATDAGYRMLMNPGLAIARRRHELQQFKAREICELGDPITPSPEQLLREVGKRDPALLFTLSHGLGAPRRGWRSAQEQRQLQGAMSFGREGMLAAEQVMALGQQPFLPGGIWFMLACYGAGTPELSAYAPWLSELVRAGQFGGQPQAVLSGLPKPGERPFIAALPQAVLRCAEGPLAFMGHIDLAWTYSFNELDAGRADAKPGRFMEILRYLLAGDRVGVAFHSLMRYFSAVNLELTSLDDSPSAGSTLAARRGHLWMLRQDLAGYILLGDPAARLPLQATNAAALPVRIAEPRAELVVASPEPPTTLPWPIGKLEEAFGQLLSEESSLKKVALDLELARPVLKQLFELYRQGGRRALGIKE